MKFSKEQIEELTTSTGGTMSASDATNAIAFCREITLAHYENFPVASFMLPKSKRDDIFPVYAFARLADDIADENPDIPVEEKLSLLNNLKNNFIQFDRQSGNPILLALRNTIKKLNLTHEPFLKLLEAFSMDIEFRQPDSNVDNLRYCSYSANPVGEIILRLFGEYDELKSAYSDDICTALQLVNFWQDISNDRMKGRCYIPAELMRKYNLSTALYFGDENKTAFSDCLNDLFDYTENLFESGRKLIPLVNSKRLRLELKMTVLGGERILKKCRKSGPGLFDRRPKLSKLDFFIIFVCSLKF